MHQAGVEPAANSFGGCHSIHWVTGTQAILYYNKYDDFSRNIFIFGNFIKFMLS